jgi:hypothetical protein
MTVRDLMEEYDGNGFVIIDAGNGCAGPMWMQWYDGVASEYGAIEMFAQAATDPAYPDWASTDTLLDVCHMVIGKHYTSDGLIYASDWIVTGSGDNPYRYRIIF